MHSTKKYRILAIFLPVQWIFIQLISHYPNLVEKYYATGIYTYISRFMRLLFGWIPFSVGDFFYATVVFLVLKGIYKAIKHRKINIVKTLAKISVLYFVFYFFWGLNYYRNPLNKSLEIDKLNYSVEALEDFTKQLIKKTNTLQIEITKNDTLKVVVPYSHKDIYSKVQQGYDFIEQQHPQFKYKTLSIKNSLLSLPLSYSGFSGYLNPFSAEAQVNYNNPMVNYPATSCHEVAHQLGYAAENEANFVGFLSAIHNEDIYFQYSGYYLALRYALNDLYHKDKEKHKEIFSSINKGIVKNMIESREHWQQFQNPLEVYFKDIFNQFLKANKQTAGIKSYNHMVGMLINYNEQHPEMLKFLN